MGAVGSVRTHGNANGAPEYSVVISCYYEESSIDEFYSRLSAAMESIGRTYEIIFVNDGSTDRTFEKLRAIFDRDEHITAILDLFKNAGQQAAITAGLCETRGRAILLMDSDLQLAPEEIPLLVQEYECGFDVVSGCRKNRRDSLMRIIPSKIANMIMRRASRSNFSDFGCTFKIYNAALIRAFEYGPCRQFSNVDLISRAGRCREIPVSHFPRKYGRSGYTFKKLMKYNMDNIVSMSERPFQIIGFASLLLAFAFLLRIALGFIFPFSFMQTVTNGLVLSTVVVSLFVLIGLLCMIGELVIRSFITSRGIPNYAIREAMRRSSS